MNSSLEWRAHSAVTTADTGKMMIILSRMSQHIRMLNLAIFSAALLLSSGLHAQPQIPEGFDGYSQVPGPTRAVPGFLMLLSQDVCSKKNAPAGWKKGAYLFRTGLESACWTMSGSDVKMCPLGQYETVSKQTNYGTSVSSCHVWPLDNFFKVQR